MFLIGMVSYQDSFWTQGQKATRKSASFLYAHGSLDAIFRQVILHPPPPPHLRPYAVMEQERTSTYLNNSKTKREATNDVKIVVNPVRQAFNTTCGVYQR